MAKINICTFTCDLCGSKQETDGKYRPNNWALIENYHSDTDRLINEKHVCDRCCSIIKKQHKDT